MLLVPNGIPLTDGSVSAPVTAIATSPPRTRAENPPKVTSMVARSPGLATSRLARVCERRSAAPERVTPMWASAGPAEVLDQRQRAGAQNLQSVVIDRLLPTARN